MSIKKNIVFFRLLSCFLVVIFLFTLSFAIIRITHKKSVKAALVENLEMEFEVGAVGMQRLLSQARYVMSEFSIKLDDDREFRTSGYLNDEKCRSEMQSLFVNRRQNEFSEYLSSVFVIDKNNPQFVCELTNKYAIDELFDNKFVSEDYTFEFWKEKMDSDAVFEIYPSSEYSVALEAKRIEQELLPVAYKEQNNSEYIIVMLLDVTAMADSFGVSAMYSEDGSFLYVSDSIDEFDVSKLIDDEDGVISEGYVFKYSDNQNGNVNTLKFVSNSDIDNANKELPPAALLLCVVCLIGALAVSVVVSAKTSSRIYAIADELMKNNGIKIQFEQGIASLSQIKEAVKQLASHELRASSDSGHRESVLDSLFLQSRVRDVYVGIEDIEERVDVSGSFFMVYFKVNYKSEFNQYLGKDAGKATFFLKQLIEMYLETWGVNAATVQIENNGIVSVFEVSESFSDEKDIVDSVVSKLSNESEYAFFTVAASGIHCGGEDIKNVCDRLIDLSKYRKPVAETQILFENEVKNGASHFYFSVEEMGKLSAMLQNGVVDEMVHKVDEILDYNIKKDINNFELYLLCTEIINCGVKLVNRILHTIPVGIELADVYRRLERSDTPDEYRKVCLDFLSEVMEHVRLNKREDDYIISYILDYVDNHYAEDIYLNLFAEKLKLTGAYISSYFKEKMNVNLSDYVNNYRIKKAVVLSENPQNKNKDIAVMVGLPNINTFIRLFKKYTGYTPGEYRKKHFGEEYQK